MDTVRIRVSPSFHDSPLPPKFHRRHPSPTAVIVAGGLRIPEALQQRVGLYDLADDVIIALVPPPRCWFTLCGAPSCAAGNGEVSHEDLDGFRFPGPGLPADEDALVFPVFGQAGEGHGAVDQPRRRDRCTAVYVETDRQTDRRIDRRMDSMVRQTDQQVRSDEADKTRKTRQGR